MDSDVLFMLTKIRSSSIKKSFITRWAGCFNSFTKFFDPVNLPPKTNPHQKLFFKKETPKENLAMFQVMNVEKLRNKKKWLRHFLGCKFFREFICLV